MRIEAMAFASFPTRIHLSISALSVSCPLGNAYQLFDEITVSATKLCFAHHPDAWPVVYASCDGLLLVGDDEGKKFLLNPITRQIREVPDSPYALNLESSDCTVMYGLGGFVDGCIHWIACIDVQYKPTIVAFDLAEEKFREVPPPSSVHSLNLVCHYFLAVLGGPLCTFNDGETDVWMMREYDAEESWTTFTIDDPEDVVDEIRPFCMLGQEEMVLLKNGKKLVMYDLKEKVFKNVVIHGILDDLLADISFMESLVSLHGSKATGRE